MARKVKLDNHIQKRLNRKEQKRKTFSRNQRKYYLIACEGEKTEPDYFRALSEQLPNNVLSACSFDVRGLGKNTKSLVEAALNLKTKLEQATNIQVDRIWVVFDRDSFPADHFNAAITACEKADPPIGCAWSNQAFELWYLLHFDYCDAAIHRDQYKAMLEKKLKPYMGENYSYRKNDNNMYHLLQQHGDRDAAIERAKRLEDKFKGRIDFAKHDPVTKVHHLITELLNLYKDLPFA